MPTLAPLLRLSFLLVLLPLALRADPGLHDVRHAQLRLGDGTWSRILRIENAGPSRYPGLLHALVFEVAGLLWFYLPSEGTQSFSLHVDDLDAEKKDFGPLLRAIDPGFTRWREVKGDAVAVNRRRALPNGCFIDSVVALRDRLAEGEPVRNPRLLSYYVNTPSGLAGHTVLAYESSDRVTVFDSPRPHRKTRLGTDRGGDPLALARALEGGRVVRAREIRLNVVAETTLARAEPLDLQAVGAERRVGLR